MYCQICNIPFDIGRIRTIGSTSNPSTAWSTSLANTNDEVDEPREAAWGSYGQSYVYSDAASPCESCTDVDPASPDEHLAGPDCECLRGYSGRRIRASEMRDITRIQCLSSKSHRWRAEPGDEDFEKAANLCFVTGIGHEGHNEITVAGLQPVKHGTSSVLVDNYTGDEEPGSSWAIPMHPRCFEMFKKQSFRNRGNVDIDSIWAWRDGDDRFEFEESEQHDTGSEIVFKRDWYRCEPGTEYLVADPFNVPGLEEIISSCRIHPSEQHNLVFPPRMSDETKDLFAKLPVEIRLMIIDLLPWKDMAHLRLSSRSFSQLPQRYFHQLVLSEMPWVWEIDGLPPKQIDWHRLWCRLSRADGGPCIDSKERARDASENGVVRELIQNEITTINTSYGATGLSPPRDDEILKGLRNRRRIYPIIEKIVGAFDLDLW